jgi:hypothetical protein
MKITFEGSPQELSQFFFAKFLALTPVSQLEPVRYVQGVTEPFSAAADEEGEGEDDEGDDEDDEDDIEQESDEFVASGLDDDPERDVDEKQAIDSELEAYVNSVDAQYAFHTFRDFVEAWVQGFEEEGAEQPDRVGLMRDLGSNRYVLGILRWAYYLKSLQRMIAKCLPDETDMERINRIAAQMVAISHVGFPDLAGTYDYSTKWRRQDESV